MQRACSRDAKVKASAEDPLNIQIQGTFDKALAEADLTTFHVDNFVHITPAKAQDAAPTAPKASVLEFTLSAALH